MKKCTIESLYFQTQIKSNQCTENVICFGHLENTENCCIIFEEWHSHVDIDLTELNRKIDGNIAEIFIDLIETINETINEQRKKDKQYRIIHHVEIFEQMTIVGYQTKQHLFGRIFLYTHKDISKIRTICSEMKINLYDVHIRHDVLFMTEYELKTMIMMELPLKEVKMKERRTKCQNEFIVDWELMSQTNNKSQHSDGLKCTNLRVYWKDLAFENYVKGEEKTKCFRETDELLIEKWIETMKGKIFDDEKEIDKEYLEKVIAKYNKNPSRDCMKRNQMMTQFMTQISQIQLKNCLTTQMKKLKREMKNEDDSISSEDSSDEDLNESNEMNNNPNENDNGIVSNINNNENTTTLFMKTKLETQILQKLNKNDSCANGLSLTNTNLLTDAMEEENHLNQINDQNDEKEIELEDIEKNEELLSQTQKCLKKQNEIEFQQKEMVVEEIHKTFHTSMNPSQQSTWIETEVSLNSSDESHNNLSFSDFENDETDLYIQFNQKEMIEENDETESYEKEFVNNNENKEMNSENEDTNNQEEMKTKLETQNNQLKLLTQIPCQLINMNMMNQNSFIVVEDNENELLSSIKENKSIVDKNENDLKQTTSDINISELLDILNNTSLFNSEKEINSNNNQPQENNSNMILEDISFNNDNNQQTKDKQQEENEIKDKCQQIIIQSQQTNNIITYSHPPTITELLNDRIYHQIPIQHQKLIPNEIPTQISFESSHHFIYTPPPPTYQEIITNYFEQILHESNKYYVNGKRQQLKPYSYHLISHLNNPLTSEISSVLCIQLLFKRVNESNGQYPSPNFDEIEGILLYSVHNIKTQFILYHTNEELLSLLPQMYKTLEIRNILCSDENDIIQKLISLIETEDYDIILAEDTIFTFDFLEKRHKKYSKGIMKKILSRLHNGTNYEGRLILSMWYIYKTCGKFSNYEIEYLSKEIFQSSLPSINYLKQNSHQQLMISFIRFHCAISLVKHFDYINRIREFAQFHACPLIEEIERGSQYKVECCLRRITNHQFELFSPSLNDLHESKPTYCVPLVMEPISGYHENPVIVLDFLSMYPTCIIAYNICYSTCLGYIDDYNVERVFGPMSYQLEEESLEQLSGNIHTTANGTMYIDASLRKGILPMMLEEILSTRQLIKKEMKRYSNDSPEYRKRNIQQLAIKLLCNVVYGYTGAGLSGRMPSSTLADSIIETSRQTLEKAMTFVEKHFDCKVIYSDTDSLFVECFGKTVEEAFDVGKRICQDFNKTIPRPMELQLEKVYFPSVNVTKKRYFGLKYESPNDIPKLEIKGLEAVRRDACGIVRGMMTEIMKYLIENDLEGMKQYLQENWKMIQKGEGNIEDYIISRPYKKNYAKGRDPPVGVNMIKKQNQQDNTFYFQYGQRIKYVIIHTTSGKLKDSAVSPQYCCNQQMIINSDYYINKQLNNSLQRLLNPCGIDITQWFDKQFKQIIFEGDQKQKRKLEDFFQIHRCIVCNKQTNVKQNVCEKCGCNESIALMHEIYMKQRCEREINELKEKCLQCQLQYPIDCYSDHCPIAFSLLRKQENLKRIISFSKNEDIEDVIIVNDFSEE